MTKKIKLRPLNSRDVEARIAKITQDIADLHQELFEAGQTAWFNDIPALKVWSDPNGTETKLQFEIGASDYDV